MAIIYSYPTVTPASGDLIVGTDITGKVTKNFTVGSIVTAGIPTHITGTTNTVPLFTAANTIGNSIITQSASKIGIGTSGISPADKLHVQGTVRAVVADSSGAAFNAINASGVSSTFRFDNNHAVLALKNNSNVVTTKISSDGFSHFTGGNVGFGTTTPSAPVDIVASVQNSGLLLSNAGDNSDYDSVRFTYSGFNAGSPEFIFTPKTQPSAGLTNTFFRFKTNGGASIANVANVSIDGKLGVGTTTPLANLDVKETTTNVAGQIIVGGLIESSADDKPFGKLCFANTANANSQPNKILASIEGRKNGSSNRGILTFGVADGSGSNWEKMRIDSYGYVGIGTTTPGSKLDVNGDITASKLISSANSAMFVEPSATSYLNHLRVDSTLGSTLSPGVYGWQFEYDTPHASSVTFRFDNDNYKIFSGAGGGEIARFTDTGNVGIGTTSPNNKLEVAGNIRITESNYLDFGGTGSIPEWRIRSYNPGLQSNDLVIEDVATTTAAVKFENGKGVVLPNKTTTEINAINSPDEGAMVYNTTLNTICFYNGTAWQKVSHTAM